MLPTKTASRLMYPTDLDLDYGKLIYNNEALCVDGVHPQNLYVISDDKIEDGDWCVDIKAKNVGQYNDKIFKFAGYDISNLKKIVAATDKSLETSDTEFHNTFKQVITQIPDSFLPVYVKANNNGRPITEVDLEMEADWENVEERAKIKIRPDNTVILHESKKYSREELENFLRQFNNDKPGMFDCTSWIDENL